MKTFFLSFEFNWIHTQKNVHIISKYTRCTFTGAIRDDSPRGCRCRDDGI